MSHMFSSASYFNQDLKAWDVNMLSNVMFLAYSQRHGQNVKNLNSLIARNETKDLTTCRISILIPTTVHRIHLYIYPVRYSI